MQKIFACIDDSIYAASVCDHAVWAAQRLQLPLDFLHVVNRYPESAPASDLSGNIGFDAQEFLLEELAELDERRSRLAQERGRVLLEGMKQRALEAGITMVGASLQHGTLVEAVTDLETETRLFVIGKCGRSAESARPHLGANLERTVRAVHRPILVAAGDFKRINHVLIAFDGSATIRMGIEMIAASPLLQGLSLHVLMVGHDDDERREQLAWAQQQLAQAGITAQSVLRTGEADSAIPEYADEHSIDLLVMGAYGHSRIRQLIVGSTTTTLLRTCDLPMLLLR